MAISSEERESLKAELRKELLDELRPRRTRRDVLKVGGAALGGAALGSVGGAAGAVGAGDEVLDVGGVTANTYRIAGNWYGGPDGAQSELVSELGAADTGARFATDDTGSWYYWNGAAWSLLPSGGSSSSLPRAKPDMTMYLSGSTITTENTGRRGASGTQTWGSSDAGQAINQFYSWYDGNTGIPGLLTISPGEYPITEQIVHATGCDVEGSAGGWTRGIVLNAPGGDEEQTVLYDAGIVEDAMFRAPNRATEDKGVASTVSKLTVDLRGNSTGGFDWTNTDRNVTSNVKVVNSEGFGYFTSGAFGVYILEGHIEGVGSLNPLSKEGATESETPAVYAEENPTTGRNNNLNMWNVFVNSQDDGPVCRVVDSQGVKWGGSDSHRNGAKIQVTGGASIAGVSGGRVYLDNFKITGENDAGITGIVLEQEDTLLRDVEVEKIETGVEVQNINKNETPPWSGLWVHDCLGDGMTITGGSGAVPPISDSIFEANGGAGVSVAAGSDVFPLLFSQTRFINNGTYGIENEGNESVVSLVNCPVEGNGTASFSTPADITENVDLSD